MTRYRIKASPKRAFKFIGLLKAVKNQQRVEVSVKPRTKVQKDLLDIVMGGFFLSIKKIKDGLE